jgi:hypothetical protein
MLNWEQAHAGALLHGYEGHAAAPVYKAEGAERHADDTMPRTTYVGPTPAPLSQVCPTCKAYERDHDPMFNQGLIVGASEAHAAYQGGLGIGEYAKGYRDGAKEAERRIRALVRG